MAAQIGLDATTPPTLLVHFDLIWSFQHRLVPTATKTNTPVPPNLVLNKNAVTSPVEVAGFESPKAVDGSATHRWSSMDPAVNPEWIYVDLDATSTPICRKNNALIIGIKKTKNEEAARKRAASSFLTPVPVQTL